MALEQYRNKRDPERPPSRSVARPRPPSSRAAVGCSASRSMPPRASTMISASRWKACCARGPCPRVRRLIPRRSGSPSTSRIIRSTTATSSISLPRMRSRVALSLNWKTGLFLPRIGSFASLIEQLIQFAIGILQGFQDAVQRAFRLCPIKNAVTACAVGCYRCICQFTTDASAFARPFEWKMRLARHWRGQAEAIV